MALLKLYDGLTAADVPVGAAAIDFDDSSPSTRIVSVGAGKPLTFYGEVTGTGDITLLLSFAPHGVAGVAPTFEDANWYELGAYAGGVLSDNGMVAWSANTKTVITTTDRVANATATAPIWVGLVPLGAVWMRILCRSTVALTETFDLSLQMDSQNYIVG
jgi:hypothetical protein